MQQRSALDHHHHFTALYQIGQLLTQMVTVDGRIQSRTYQAKDGTNRTVLEVVANNINFCGSKADNPGQTSTAPAGQPNVGAPAPAYSQGPGDDFALIEDEGDLPF